MSSERIKSLGFFDYPRSTDIPYLFKKDYNDPTLRNPEMCAKCGGECCKRCGCFFSPDDFEEVSYESLKAEMAKGYITIEHVDLDMYYMVGYAWVVRVRNQSDPVVVSSVYHRPNSPCVMLGPDGCKFDWEHRPAGGKLLKPDNGLMCDSDYTLRQTVREWRRYQNILYMLAEYFSEEDIPCTL